MDLLAALRSGASVFAAELRPPRAELAHAEGMDAWIDTYHAVRRLTRQGTFVFLTDSAVGARGGRQPAAPGHESRAATCRASGSCRSSPRSIRSSTACRTPSARTRAAFRRSWCSAATSRSARRDRSSTRGSCARCCASATARSRSAAGRIRMAIPSGRSTFSPTPDFHAEFYLTQIVSHHTSRRSRGSCETADGAASTLPGLFGVFYYRSANRADARGAQAASCRCRSRG